MVKLKRVYEKPEPKDGYRILVDRLWPRGMNKERAKIDRWLKDIAPSTELRKWFRHDPDKLAEFRVRYSHELNNNAEIKTILQLMKQHSDITLLYAAKDTKVNHAVVLKGFLTKK